MENYHNSAYYEPFSQRMPVRDIPPKLFLWTNYFEELTTGDNHQNQVHCLGKNRHSRDIHNTGTLLSRIRKKKRRCLFVLIVFADMFESIKYFFYLCQRNQVRQCHEIQCSWYYRICYCPSGWILQTFWTFREAGIQLHQCSQRHCLHRAALRHYAYAWFQRGGGERCSLLQKDRRAAMILYHGSLPLSR